MAKANRDLLIALIRMTSIDESTVINDLSKSKENQEETEPDSAFFESPDCFDFDSR